MNKTKFDRIRDFIIENGLPRYRFDQITHAIFNQRIGEFERITTLPKHLRKELSQEFGDTILSIRPVAESESEQAAKVLFELPDGHRVEAVRMIYKAGWKSFCISSQSGCGFGCSFCATGAIGLKRNLTADEITDQVLYFHLQGHKIDSISFMGMGEPFANPATFTALRTLTDKALFGLSPRRITISTIGIIPGIKRLTEEFPQVNLTFSLHSPFNEQRNELVPLNRSYPIEEVMQALDEHIKRTRRKVYIAYIMLRGVNDTPAHAKALISLLRGRGRWHYLYHINLIRYNPAVGAYKCSDKKTIDRFRQQLKSAGINVTLRQSFGVNIDAACGQLYGRYRTRTPSFSYQRSYSHATAYQA